MPWPTTSSVASDGEGAVFGLVKATIDRASADASDRPTADG